MESKRRDALKAALEAEREGWHAHDTLFTLGERQWSFGVRFSDMDDLLAADAALGEALALADNAAELLSNYAGGTAHRGAIAVATESVLADINRFLDRHDVRARLDAAKGREG